MHAHHTNQLFFESLERLVTRHPKLVLDVDWNTGVSLVAALQLALRHPHFDGPAALNVRDLLDRIFARLDTIEPTLAKLLRMGDDPQHDTPRTST